MYLGELSLLVDVEQHVFLPWKNAKVKAIHTYSIHTVVVIHNTSGLKVLNSRICYAKKEQENSNNCTISATLSRKIEVYFTSKGCFSTIEQE